ncbi:MAG TPA: sigma-70 family RNA polymerase sigma factor [Mycobacteriales bacterium]|nr:sigma-70 family RNA polymerase sigma factor [Mycobacteriales bacterium]
MTVRDAGADAATFEEHRGLLFGIAYRMLGTSADAEDAVQETWLRWSGRTQRAIDSPRAYLTTVITRLCVDELRSARVRRESYYGPWLPEPLVVEESLLDEDSASAHVVMSDSLSQAFLVVLEELSPAERAAFLLHDVFGYEYAEIASMLTRGEAACRQLVSRARAHVGARRHRFDADRGVSHELAQRFLLACATGDIEGLMAMLAEDVVVWTDGGGVAKAAANRIFGAAKSARFLAGIARKQPEGAFLRLARVNGEPGAVVMVGDELVATIAVEVADGRAIGVYIVSNPEKLGAVQPGAGAASPFLA